MIKQVITIITMAIVLASCASSVCAGNSSDLGFDAYGYNYSARIFNGTGESWAISKGIPIENIGIYAKDKLIVKWNEEWDRGVYEDWQNGPYYAWLNNEWNGKIPEGSGAIWKYKIIWDGNCADGIPSLENAYCMNDKWAVIMDHGIDLSLDMGPGHLCVAHAIPSGYGARR